MQFHLTFLKATRALLALVAVHTLVACVSANGGRDTQTPTPRPTASVAGQERGGEVHVMISGGLTAAYRALLPEFERSTGIKTFTSYGASMGQAPDAIPVRLKRGERADVLIMVGYALEDLIEQGVVDGGSRRNLARSKVGMVVRAGQPKPDISSVAAFKRAMLEAESIGYSASASGRFISQELFPRLGLSDELAKKGQKVLSERVGTVVARGEVEVGFQQVSELLPIPGVDFVGPLPPELQKITIFSGGITTEAKNRDAANILIDYFMSAGARAIEESGMEPIHATRRPVTGRRASVGYNAGHELPFAFFRRNPRGAKPRANGITEIRGPYYTPVGKRYLADVLETMGPYIDSFKFAGGSFMLMDRQVIKELIDLCHQHGVMVSTGGFIEAVLPYGNEAVDRYLAEAKSLGFDIIEVSNGMIVIPDDDLVRMVTRINEMGLKAKAEIGIQLGAGSASSSAELQAEGTRETASVVALGRRLLDAGAWMVMLQSEGITEHVPQWRTDVISQIATELGTERVMFQAADPSVFRWYIKNYGPQVNLFVDHSQIVQLESLRSGTWGPKNLWQRIVRYQ